MWTGDPGGEGVTRDTGRGRGLCPPESARGSGHHSAAPEGTPGQLPASCKDMGEELGHRGVGFRVGKVHL